MKKLLSLLLSIVLLLTVMPMGAVTVSAATYTPTISVNNVEALPGETVDVVVSLANNPGIVSMRIEVAYDANVLEFVGKAPGTAFGGMAFGPDTANPFIFNWADYIHPNNKSNGTFATLTLKVKEGAALGKSDITVTYDPDNIYNLDFDNVAFETVNGSVTVFKCEHSNTYQVEENCVESTCTTKGSYDSVTYCSECNRELSRETVTIEKTPHYVNVSGYNGPVYYESNDTTNPFSISGGVYTSTNKSNNSSSTYTITAIHDCTLDLAYGVSSEGSCDFLTIEHNNVQVDKISGSVSNKTTTLTLNAGDTITITYSKDMSVSVGNDSGWFNITVDVYLVQAELANPLCDKDVTCYYCGNIVYHKVGHTFGEVVPYVAPTCLTVGNVEYKECAVCNKNYSADADVYCTTPLDTIVIEKLPHNVAENGICMLCGNNPCLEFLSYKIANGAISIIGCQQDFVGKMIIPDTIDGYKVKIIGESAFVFCTEMTEVVIPEGVIIIKDSAFAGCTSLERVSIPSTVTSISSNAFGEYDYYNPNHNWYYDIYNTHNIKRVDITDLDAWLGINFVTSFSNPLHCGADLYLNGEKLTSINISEDYTRVNDYAFYGCTSLKTVTMADSVTSVGAYAFEGCTALNSVAFGNKLNTISEYAFWGCCSLKNVVIPSSIRGIGWEAFKRCTSLESVTICDAEEYDYYSHYIDSYAFADCTSLKTVNIGNAITSIGTSAFNNCTSLEDVSIGERVSGIASGAFSGCQNIERVYINDISNWLCINFENYYNSYPNPSNPLCTSNPLCYGADLYVNGEKLIELVIPQDITYIREYAFNGCLSIEKIVIHNAVTNISAYAFNNCDNITQIDYYGTKRQWNAIGKGNYNDALYLANIEYIVCENHVYDDTSDKICNVCAKERAYVPGDLNGKPDGVINNKDLGVLMQYLNGWDYTDISLQAADINGDGAVNNRDYGILMRYINGWDVELQ